jgi:Transglycosylase SLT domain
MVQAFSHYRIYHWAICLIGLFLVSGRFAYAVPSHLAGDICTLAIYKAEQRYKVPHNLLQAISLAESGRFEAGLGRSTPWPWTVTNGGQGEYLPSRAAAIAYVKKLWAKGERNIDVGCMQVNLYAHPKAFTTLEQAFDPIENVNYAASFLASWQERQKNWSAAIGYYHSATPEFNLRYRQKVQRLWRQLDPALVEKAAQALAAYSPATQGETMQGEPTQRQSAERQPARRQQDPRSPVGAFQQGFGQITQARPEEGQALTPARSQFFTSLLQPAALRRQPAPNRSAQGGPAQQQAGASGGVRGKDLEAYRLFAMPGWKSPRQLPQLAGEPKP